MTFKTIDGIDIELGEMIASSKKGLIYSVTTPDYNTYVVKLVSNINLESKIDYLLNTSSLKVTGVVLPSFKVYSITGAFAGYAMPSVRGIALSYICNNFLSKKLPKVIRTSLDFRNKIINHYRRKTICYNIAIMVKKLYDNNNIILYNLNPQNIVIHPNLTVSLLGIDNLYSLDNPNINIQVDKSNTDYLPLDSVEGKEIDFFSLAIMFYEVLTGMHPYYSNNDDITINIKNNNCNLDRLFTNIPELSVQKAFVRAFQLGYNKPKVRPTIDEYIVLFSMFNLPAKFSEFMHPYLLLDFKPYDFTPFEERLNLIKELNPPLLKEIKTLLKKYESLTTKMSNLISKISIDDISFDKEEFYKIRNEFYNSIFSKEKSLIKLLKTYYDESYIKVYLKYKQDIYNTHNKNITYYNSNKIKDKDTSLIHLLDIVTGEFKDLLIEADKIQEVVEKVHETDPNLITKEMFLHFNTVKEACLGFPAKHFTEGDDLKLELNDYLTITEKSKVDNVNSEIYRIYNKSLFEKIKSQITKDIDTIESEHKDFLTVLNKSENDLEKINIESNKLREEILSIQSTYLEKLISKEKGKTKNNLLELCKLYYEYNLLLETIYSKINSYIFI